MNTFEIITDGSCDLNKKLVNEYDIKVVNFSVTFDKEKIYKENEDITADEFYKMMLNNHNNYPSSSCPSPLEYYDVFLKSVLNKTPILCICITSKFSGSYSAACVAKSMILEEYRDAIIEVIDSRVNTVLQGLFVLEAARMRENGHSFLETCQMVKNTFGSRIFFTVSNLKYLQHGGRIGKLSALLGNILQINPLIVLKHGEIYSGGFAIKRKRALVSILNKIETYFEKYSYSYSDYRFVVGYGHDIEEGKKLKEMIDKRFNVNCELSQIGATIAVHTGPEPLGVAFVRKFDHQLQNEAAKVKCNNNLQATL